MSRRLTALKPQLNRIRAWAHEGSTDAWIAHQLETTADAVRAFRQEHGIERGGPAPLAPITPDSVVEAMLAEEEAAAAAAELAPEASVSEIDSPPEPESESAPARAPRRRARKRAAEPAEVPEAEASVAEEAADEAAAPAADAPARSSRRRGARGGSGRAASAPVAEAAEEAPAVDGEAAGEDEPSRSGTARKRSRRGRGRGRGRGLEARLLPGSVLLLDPAVTADPAFQEHWGDAGALRVEISADSIVLRRAAADGEPDRS